MKQFQLYSKETLTVVWTAEAENEEGAYLVYARYAGVPLSVAYRYLDAREVRS